MQGGDSAILLRDRYKAGSHERVIVMEKVPERTDVVFQFFGER